MTSPYLSVVLASRNDDYAGGMLPRLQVCVDNFVEQAERHQLKSELVMVDWNPPPERAALWNALTWPERATSCSIRVIQVPGSVHRRSVLSDRLAFLAHKAWNVGVRRARGHFILSTTNDVLLSDSLMKFLASEVLESDRIYRIDRRDVPEDVLNQSSLDERLVYASDNVLKVHEWEGSMHIPGYDLNLHTNAAGDFMLLSQENWRKLHGMPEEGEYAAVKFDGLMCYLAYAAGARLKVLESPMHLYHASHKPHPSNQELSALHRWFRWLPLPRRLAIPLVRISERVAPPKNDFDRMSIPYVTKQGFQTMVTEILQGKRSYPYNDESWGLGEEELPERNVVVASWEKEELVGDGA